MLKQFPELEGISIKPISSFYKTKARLSYKRVLIRERKKLISVNALNGFLKFIKQKLDSGYLIFSLDETSFGIDDNRKYGWGKIGKKVSKTFEAM